MSQVKTKSTATKHKGRVEVGEAFKLLRDSTSHRFVVVFFDNSVWTQAPQESAREFYFRLSDKVNASGVIGQKARTLLEQHREEILADDYVDPILYESGFFRDKSHHDDFMSRVMADFEKKEQEKKDLQ